MIFHLAGLAAGLVGRKSIFAEDLDALFAAYPALAAAQGKLSVNGANISGFAPCDG